MLAHCLKRKGMFYGGGGIAPGIDVRIMRAFSRFTFLSIRTFIRYNDSYEKSEPKEEGYYDGQEIITRDPGRIKKHTGNP